MVEMRDGGLGFGFFETSAVVFRHGKQLEDLKGSADATKVELAHRVNGTTYSLNQLLDAVCGRSAAARILLWIAMTIISAGIVWVVYACYVSSRIKNSETLIGCMSAIFAATPAQREETAGGASDASEEAEKSTTRAARPQDRWRSGAQKDPKDSASGSAPSGSTSGGPHSPQSALGKSPSQSPSTKPPLGAAQGSVPGGDGSPQPQTSPPLPSPQASQLPPTSSPGPQPASVPLQSTQAQTPPGQPAPQPPLAAQLPLALSALNPTQLPQVAQPEAEVVSNSAQPVKPSQSPVEQPDPLMPTQAEGAPEKPAVQLPPAPNASRAETPVQLLHDFPEDERGESQFAEVSSSDLQQKPPAAPPPSGQPDPKAQPAPAAKPAAQPQPPPASQPPPSSSSATPPPSAAAKPPAPQSGQKPT
ncbi:MAG: hypothetical protein LBI39_01240 [Puniceicoccales bacterium]|nr:hypothetical protein [Puniceicoccales bacterium]